MRSSFIRTFWATDSFLFSQFLILIKLDIVRSESRFRLSVLINLRALNTLSDEALLTGRENSKETQTAKSGNKGTPVTVLRLIMVVQYFSTVIWSISVSVSTPKELKGSIAASCQSFLAKSDCKYFLNSEILKTVVQYFKVLNFLRLKGLAFQKVQKRCRRIWT